MDEWNDRVNGNELINERNDPELLKMDGWVNHSLNQSSWKGMNVIQMNQNPLESFKESNQWNDSFPSL